MRHRRWSPVRSRTLWRGLRLTTVVVMVLNLGWLTAAAGLASQAALQDDEDLPGVDGSEYESPMNAPDVAAVSAPCPRARFPSQATSASRTIRGIRP